MADDDVIAIGAANFTKRTRTNKSGKSKDRYTVDVSGDSLLINCDAKSLGRAPAEAIAKLYKERISSIPARASEATIRARKAAAKAFSEGAAWAQRRYSGGRVGAMAPNQSDRKFTDSGRLAQISVNATQDEYKINFPANRWQADDVRGGEAGLLRIWEQLKALVPELGDVRKLLDSIPVRRALEQGIKDMVLKAEERTLELKRAKMQAQIQVARAFLSLVA